MKMSTFLSGGFLIMRYNTYMELDIKTINHNEQRYNTVGDYYDEDNIIKFRISKTNDDYEFLVLIHELVEWYLTKKHGIIETDIKAFDELFEEERNAGLHTLDEEPGHDVRAPYRNEHIYAELIERLIANKLNIDWSKYDKVINNL